MTENRLNDFDDEVLSALIDKQPDAPAEADVAADPVALERLTQMRRATELVAQEPAPATPARRASSIAAAMLAAESLQSDEEPAIASLSAKRESKKASLSNRIDYRWVGAAAAAILLVVAIPLALQARPDADTTVTDTAADSASFNAADGEDAGSDGAAAVADDTGDAAGDAVAESAAASTTSAAAMSEDDAMEDDSAADDAMTEEAPADLNTTDADAEETSQRLDLRSVVSTSSVLGLEELIDVGALQPTWTFEELRQAGVEAGAICTERFESNQEPDFEVVMVGNSSITDTVIIYFNPDGDIELLDPVECQPYR